MRHTPARRLGALLAALVVLASPATACPLPATALQAGALQLAWQAAPAPAVGSHFALQVQVCPPDARLTAVDAQMPEHRHGMNYRPTLTALGDGRWRVEGLMFHMAGHWQLQFDVEAGGRRQTLRDSVQLR